MSHIKRLVTLVGATIIAVNAGGCASAPRQRAVEGGPVDTGPGTTRTARDYLEGRWSLMSFEVFPPGKGSIAVPGSGTLVYDEYGNLKMDLRVDEATSRTLAGVGIPITNGLLSTDGRVVVDMAGRKLTYMIDGQAPIGESAGPLATNRPRYWQVEGNVLTLTTRDDQGNPLSVGRWQKTP
jgi:hypothetical protein